MSEEPHEEAFRRWGARGQLLALAEELAEATAAVARLLSEKGDPLEVVEELVDVESVAASLRDYLAAPSLWENVRARKRAKLIAALARGHPRTRVPSEGGR